MVKVSPLRSTGWSVELNPGEQPYLFSIKGQAISFALAWADQHQPCELHVYGRYGELERIMKFPNGNHRSDPELDRRRMQADIAFPDRRHEERRKRA